MMLCQEIISTLGTLLNSHFAQTYGLDQLTRWLRPLIPTNRADDGFGVGYTLDTFRMAASPVEVEHRSPVMYHKCDIIYDLQGIKPGIEVTSMVYETIRTSRGFA